MDVMGEWGKFSCLKPHSISQNEKLLEGAASGFKGLGIMIYYMIDY